MSWKPEMSDIISNTSPLLYLYRIGADSWSGSVSLRWPEKGRAEKYPEPPCPLPCIFDPHSIKKDESPYYREPPLRVVIYYPPYPYVIISCPHHLLLPACTNTQFLPTGTGQFLPARTVSFYLHERSVPTCMNGQFLQVRTTSSYL